MFKRYLYHISSGLLEFTNIQNGGGEFPDGKMVILQAIQFLCTEKVKHPFVMKAYLSNLAKSEFNVPTNSCGVSIVDSSVKPLTSAYKMLKIYKIKIM